MTTSPGQNPAGVPRAGSTSAARPEVAIRISAVEKSFGADYRLSIERLEILVGETVAIVGPSGAGKSTLLSLLGGFTRPDRGAITVLGKAAEKHRGSSRLIRSMFQDVALLPHLACERQLSLAARLGGFPRAAATTEARRWLSLLGLEDRPLHLPSQLSGGQRQRLSLGRALIARPRVLLLDEPMGALDHELRSAMWQVIDSMPPPEPAMTTILVTHDPDVALSRSTKIVVLVDGRIVQEGTPREVYTTPSDPRAARLLGPANTFTVDRRVAVVRPESIRLASADMSGGDGIARIIKLSFLGRMTEVTLLWHDSLLLSRVPTAAASTLAINDAVAVSWSSADITYLS